MKEIGYHGTYLKHKKSIEENGLDPTLCNYRSDHWLGQGVYFFSDYKMANWWASSLSERNNHCGALIFESVIEASDNTVLDLDDNTQLDYFLTYIMQQLENIEKECNGEIPIFDKNNFRAIFFDYYKQHNGISVIIGTFQKDYAGYTEKRSYDERIKQRKILNAIGLKFKERQFCVSDKNCIKSMTLVYNEEDEVI